MPRTRKPVPGIIQRPGIGTWAQRNAQVALASLGRLWRQPVGSLMTILVIGIALALPLNFHLLVKNVQTLSGYWSDSASISLYLASDVGDDAIQALRQQLLDRAEVAEVRHITPQQGLQEFRQAAGMASALELLDANPLPHALVVIPVPGPQAFSRMQALIQAFQSDPRIEAARADLRWLQRLHAITRLAGRGVLALSLLLALAVALVIGNTIRLEIQSRRHEIEVVKLVGGTHAFIRRPFLYEGFWYGLLGGLSASLLVLLSAILLSGPLDELKLLYQSDFQFQGLNLSTFLGTLAGSALLGVAGAWLAVAQHLDEIEPV